MRFVLREHSQYGTDGDLLRLLNNQEVFKGSMFLDFSHCMLTKKSLRILLSLIKANGITLTGLILSDNTMSDADLQVVINLVQSSPHLQHFYMERVNLRQASFDQLLFILASHQYLVSLSVMGNPVTDWSSLSLIDIRANRTRLSTSLSKLLTEDWHKNITAHLLEYLAPCSIYRSPSLPAHKLRQII